MNRISHALGASSLALTCVALGTACSSENGAGSNASAGNGGGGGTGGGSSGGAGGASATGGVGGVSGVGGTAGSSAGSGGTSGATTGGSAGLGAAGAAAGSGGAAGSTAGVAGIAGASDGGVAGSSGAGAGGSTAGAAGDAAGASGSAGQASGGGAGGPSCAAGQSACGGSCFNLKTDAANCGACNSPCTGGRVCTNGACQCMTGNCATLPAFPGADGAAGTVTGGRGGDVYHVTRLDTDSSDMAAGTLRYGLSNLSGPRTIVFDVSGVFRLGRTAVSGWDSNGNGWDTASRLNVPANVTIAGQTAPGPVIIAGGSVKPGATNIIIRNVTFAPGYGNRGFDEPMKPPVSGDFPDSYVYDALDISGQRVMIDHVTTLYATDETVSMNELASDITIEFSIIAQGQNYPQADAESSSVKYTGHALGSLFQAGSNAKVSVHHNLYAHLKGRLPRVGTEAGALTTAGVGAFNDFRNNVFYNWLGTAGTGASGQASQNNFVGNFYLAGNGGDDASGGTSTAITTSGGGTSIFNGSDATNTKLYQSGNAKDTNRDGDANDGVALTNADFSSSAIQGSAFTQAPYTGVTDTAAQAFDRVLSYAGSRYWQRSAVDARLVAETRAGTGKIVAWADDPFNTSGSEGTEWRALIGTAMTARPSGFDTDLDGMPDAWETAHGTNPMTADNNGDLDADGYTNLEEYINELAAWPAPGPLAFVGAGNRRYAELRNWSVLSPGGRARSAPFSHWQPSRFDTARVLAGTAVVDAPGQAAGALALGGEHAAATLEVASGWLDVAERVTVGAVPEGRRVRPLDGLLRVNGGRLAARGGVVLGGTRGARGVCELSGGVLATPSLDQAPFGGVFRFTGGLLTTARVGFDLVDEGGIIQPDLATGRLLIEGDLVLRSGALRIALGDESRDGIHVTGRAVLGGALELDGLTASASEAERALTILRADGGVTGTFSSVPPGYSVEVVGRRVLVRFGAPLSPDAGICALAAGEDRESRFGG